MALPKFIDGRYRFINRIDEEGDCYGRNGLVINSLIHALVEDC